MRNDIIMILGSIDEYSVKTLQLQVKVCRLPVFPTLQRQKETPGYHTISVSWEPLCSAGSHAKGKILWCSVRGVGHGTTAFVSGCVRSI